MATGRERHHWAGIGGGVPAGTPRRSAMRDKLRTPVGRGVYARRKTITEPVFGCIKQARGFGSSCCEAAPGCRENSP